MRLGSGAEEARAPSAWRRTLLLGQRRPMLRPRIVANPGAHGAVGLGSGAGGRLLGAAATTVATAVALARAAALLPIARAAAGLGRRCCATARASRGGARGAGAAPAQTGTTRTGRCEEGGVGDALLIVREPSLLKDEHVVGAGEHRKNG